MSSKTQTKKNDSKKDEPASKPVQLSQPTLDFQRKMMLDGKKDKVEGLECVIVRFYPANLQEVMYVVRNEDDSTTEMTTSAFQSYMQKKKKGTKEEHERLASKGFYAKVMKRCLIDIGEDSVENVRAVNAGKIPKAAATILGRTQEEVKLAKLNDQKNILAHWTKMPEAVKVEMNEWQKRLLPDSDVSWTENIANLYLQMEEEEKAKLQKRLEKSYQTSTKKVEKTELDKAMENSVKGVQPAEAKAVEPKTPADSRGIKPPSILKPSAPSGAVLPTTTSWGDD